MGHCVMPRGNTGGVARPCLDCACVQRERREMPDNTRPPRHLVDPDPRPTLGVRALMAAVEEVARAKGLREFRVGYKRNDRDEHVVALIFPPQPP
jgi:hypothetical protein